jgi:hypothetical protein
VPPADPETRSRFKPSPREGSWTGRATRGATRQSDLDDTGLGTVVDAWPELPEAINAGILAMVRVARS